MEKDKYGRNDALLKQSQATTGSPNHEDFKSNFW